MTAVDYGVLPADWTLSRVDRIARVNARIGWKALTAAEYQPDGYAFLATPNIKSKDLDFENVNYISQFRYDESPELKLTIGDVLLAKDGNTLGVCNVVRTLPRPATVNGSIAVLRPGAVEPRFLRYVLASAPVQEHIDAVKDGMGVPHLFQRDIKRIDVPLPPQDEQRRIADFLDAETAHIDKIVERRAQQRQLLVQRREAVADQTFSSFVSARQTRLKFLLRQKPRYGVLVPEFVDGGVPFIRVNDLLDLPGRSDELRQISLPQSRQYSRTVVQQGDLLLSVVGTVGRAAIAPSVLTGANIARAVCSIRVRFGVSAELVAAWTMTASFKRQAILATGTDTAQPTLGMEDLANFALQWPSDQDEQRAAMNTLMAKVAAIQNAERAVGSQETTLKERRHALIAAAVTGQFDVTTARGADLP